MVAVGLWSALSARSAGRELLWGPMGFAAMLLAGAVLGLQGVALPAVEPMIAASLLATGLLVVSRLRVPGLVAALGVGGLPSFTAWPTASSWRAATAPGKPWRAC